MIDPELVKKYPEEVIKELEKSLREIGDIRPVWDEECQEYGFSHPLYSSVDAPGDTEEECIRTFHRLLAKFISERMKGNLAPHVENMTRGKGGFRTGSGRPKGTKKELKLRIYLPVDIVNWLRSDPGHIEELRRLMGS